METITLRFTSSAPLLQHNAQLADPLNQYSKALKEVSGKKKKTDDDYAEMARIEYLGGLYCDKKGPYVPAEAIQACINEGAKLSKRGRDISRGVLCLETKVHLQYKGPKDPEKLFENQEFRDVRSVGVSGRRISRTRPRFNDWKLEVKLGYNPQVIDKSDLVRFAKDAGQFAGLGDFRPSSPKRGGPFGRFEVEVVGG